MVNIGRTKGKAMTALGRVVVVYIFNFGVFSLVEGGQIHHDLHTIECITYLHLSDSCYFWFSFSHLLNSPMLLRILTISPQNIPSPLHSYLLLLFCPLLPPTFSSVFYYFDFFNAISTDL